MAISKIRVVKTEAHMKSLFAYVTDDKKVVDDSDPERTIKYVYGINCSRNIDDAIREFAETREIFGKEKPARYCYHLEQSFAPGEVTPEEAHIIGMEYAERLYDGNYQILMATHIDRDHIHNHFIINSVGMDGRMFHESDSDYYKIYRPLNDEICRAHGLSVLEEPKNYHGRSKDTGEWNADKSGTPTYRGTVAADVKEAYGKTTDFQAFIKYLRTKGYKVRVTEKHITVQDPKRERGVRLDRDPYLGEEWTPDKIMQRIVTAEHQQEVLAGFSAFNARAATSEQRNIPDDTFVPFTPEQIKYYGKLSDLYSKPRILWTQYDYYYLRALYKLKNEAAHKGQQFYDRTANVSIYQADRDIKKMFSELSFFQEKKSVMKKAGGIEAYRDIKSEELDMLCRQRKKIWREADRLPAGSPERAEKEKEKQQNKENISDCRKEIRQCNKLLERIEEFTVPPEREEQEQQTVRAQEQERKTATVAGNEHKHERKYKSWDK